MAKKKLDQYHYFEVMDRSSVVMDHFATHVCDHPAVTQDKKLEKACEKVIDDLNKVYQLSAQLFYKQEQLLIAKNVKTKKS